METTEQPGKEIAARKVGPAIAAAILASILFSGKGILTKDGMAHGATSFEMLALRMVIAAPVYATILFWSLRRAPVAPKLIAKAMGLGLLGFYICPSLNVYGLQTVSASLERVLIHASPAMIILASWFKGREVINRKMLFALAVCYGGVVISLLGRDGGRAAADPIGVACILVCCVLYALFIVESVSMQKTVGAITFASSAMLASALVCTGQSIVTGHTAALLHPPAGIIVDAVTLAIACTVFPAYLNAYGLKILGAGRVAVCSMVGPLFTPVAAALMIGERMSMLQIAGFATVFTGGILLSRNRSAVI